VSSILLSTCPSFIYGEVDSVAGLHDLFVSGVPLPVKHLLFSPWFTTGPMLIPPLPYHFYHRLRVPVLVFVAVGESVPLASRISPYSIRILSFLLLMPWSVQLPHNQSNTPPFSHSLLLTSPRTGYTPDGVGDPGASRLFSSYTSVPLSRDLLEPPHLVTSTRICQA